jgi:hypothetical protein
MLTPLDILTFYIWDRFFTENFDDFTIFIFIFNLITCIRTSRNTDVQHITSLHQIEYVQRIRCTKIVLKISNCISHLKMARPVGAETCSE